MSKLNNSTLDPRYRQQQNCINETVSLYCLKVFRPDYHGDTNDHNTVLVYTEADFTYNKNLDSRMCYVPHEMYKKPIWTFENSDPNGQLDLGFARLTPYRRLDLRGSDWGERLRASILLASCEHTLRAYLFAKGGVLELKENDEFLNDLNREIISQMTKAFGEAYIGSVNHYGPQRAKIGDGSAPVLTEPKLDELYNFSCDFVIPKYDEKLESYIREWNTDEGYSKAASLTEMIENRIRDIGGVHLWWR